MVNRDELTLYFRNITRQAGVLQPLSQQRDHFAVGTAALTRIFESQRVGFSFIIVQFVIGLSILLTVDDTEKRQGTPA